MMISFLPTENHQIPLSHLAHDHSEFFPIAGIAYDFGYYCYTEDTSLYS
jgi:hypothetical protein